MLLGIDAIVAVIFTIISGLLTMPDKLNVTFNSQLNWYIWLLIIFAINGFIIGVVIMFWTYCGCSWCPKCSECCDY